jgi:hypothetical protein
MSGNVHRATNSLRHQGPSMLSLLALIVAASVVAATDVSSQGTASDPFNGAWRLNGRQSAAGSGALPSAELLTIRVANGTLDYVVESSSGDRPARKSTFAARYNDTTWAEARNFDRFAQLKVVKVTDRLHYWVLRGSNGRAAGLVMHRMAEDGKSFAAVTLGLDGNVEGTRVYDKQ